MSVKPRRTFLPSFVVTVVGTLGVAGAAPSETKAPPAPPKAPPTAKDKDKTKAPPVKPPATARHWRIYKQKTTCFADSAADACPPQPAGKPIPPCNPPRPTKYACPEGVTLPFNVIQPAGSTVCLVDVPPMTCPPDMSCNPPPPRKVPCP